jgi:type IV secretory pathway TraG/TraD family ATPase VirD4
MALHALLIKKEKKKRGGERERERERMALLSRFVVLSKWRSLQLFVLHVSTFWKKEKAKFLHYELFSRKYIYYKQFLVAYLLAHSYAVDFERYLPFIVTNTDNNNDLNIIISAF